MPGEGEVVHPFARDVDGAVLDVNLGHGQTCEAVANALRARRVPFVLNTGDLDIVAVQADSLWSTAAARVVHLARVRGLMQERVLIAGVPRKVDDIAAVLERETWLGYQVAGALVPDAPDLLGRQSFAEWLAAR